MDLVHPNIFKVDGIPLHLERKPFEMEAVPYAISGPHRYFGLNKKLLTLTLDIS